jgi:tRNA threonylcarbamoyladenosine biosynthesis protein TsaE
MDYISNSLAETENLAQKIVDEDPSLSLIGLSGDLGSGKTAFVRGLAKCLGIKKNITSPTFVIEKNYQGKNRNLIHIDAYRLSSLSDLEAIGFNEAINDKKNLVVIEWPEKVFSQIPNNMRIINFRYLDEEKRKISY